MVVQLRQVAVCGRRDLGIAGVCVRAWKEGTMTAGARCSARGSHRIGSRDCSGGDVCVVLLAFGEEQIGGMSGLVQAHVEEERHQFREEICLRPSARGTKQGSDWLVEDVDRTVCAAPYSLRKAVRCGERARVRASECESCSAGGFERRK